MSCAPCEALCWRRQTRVCVYVCVSVFVCAFVGIFVCVCVCVCVCVQEVSTCI